MASTVRIFTFLLVGACLGMAWGGGLLAWTIWGSVALMVCYVGLVIATLWDLPPSRTPHSIDDRLEEVSWRNIPSMEDDR